MTRQKAYDLVCARICKLGHGTTSRLIDEKNIMQYREHMRKALEDAQNSETTQEKEFNEITFDIYYKKILQLLDELEQQ